MLACRNPVIFVFTYGEAATVRKTKFSEPVGMAS